MNNEVEANETIATATANDILAATVNRDANMDDFYKNFVIAKTTRATKQERIARNTVYMPIGHNRQSTLRIVRLSKEQIDNASTLHENRGLKFTVIFQIGVYAANGDYAGIGHVGYAPINGESKAFQLTSTLKTVTRNASGDLSTLEFLMNVVDKATEIATIYTNESFQSDYTREKPAPKERDVASAPDTRKIRPYAPTQRNAKK